MPIDLDQRRIVGDEILGAAPAGDIRTLWEDHLLNLRLVNPANRRTFKVIVVGTGLAGAGAASTLSELGYQVEASRSPGSTADRSPRVRSGASRSHAPSMPGGRPVNSCSWPVRSSCSRRSAPAAPGSTPASRCSI